MYAIVDIAGKQFKVSKDRHVYAPKLEGDEGSTVEFDKVLLLDDGGNIAVGAPTVSGARVTGKILEHVKDDKVIVFKKKRRKGYKVKNGHRQQLTKLQIVSLDTDVAPSPAKKKAAPKAVESKKEATPKKEVAAKKEAAPKKTVASKKAASDNLTKVEGIGPKVAELFADNGIKSFKDLASKTAEDLKAILTPAGGRYAAMDCETWPKQAELAADGKWDELKKWQDELNGGK